MFSSFNTFLPSVLSTHKSPTPQPAPIQMEAEDEETETKDQEEDKGLEKEKKANETFIFVRPPPAKSNHPLNIQVQLVPPNSRTPGGVSSTVTPRQSIDGDSQSVEDVPLSRTSSNRSDYSSTASLSSFSSTASGRRTIIPLYNLQAHNVMTNTIVDAGTDAKIAKFVKRGIEMIDLAGMEPIEVWAANANKPMLISVGTLDTNNIINNSRSSYLGSRPTTPTPTSSAISLSSAGSHVPSVASDGQAPKKKENIFGRMFKKKGEAIPIPNIPTPIPSTPTATPTPTPKRHSRHLSATSPYMPRTPSPTPTPLSKRLSLSSTSGAPPPPSQDPEQPVSQQVLLPATLGIQPLLNISVPPPPNPATYATLVSLFTSSAYPPQFAKGGNPFIGRGPAMYVWTVRRWFKGNEGNSVIAGMLSGGRQPTVGEGVDVRVEWRRGKKPKSRGGRTKAEGIKERDMAVEEQVEKKRFHRTSVASVSSMGSVEPGSRAGSRIRRQRTVDLGEDDDGEDSDPEDSETPWTCTVKVKRVAPSSPGVPAGSLGASVKIKVGTLSPTPHHPKVVAMLKVPYPLPDVEVERVKIVKRKVVTVSADGDEGEGDGTKRVVVSEGKLMGLVLSAEEIKDVVCSTGLWLVVREGFGGVGKVSRKGDGWRIRA
ncbi:hypothetical protein CPB85DRAFT_1441126 [Mucidula mucida]|nr:hypothetical protein CPB85DRAFT_1441126 [Mucidula mucida]